jgi:hypothetical protein
MFEGVNMSFETKSKIEFVCVIIGIAVLFAMPFMVMAAG